eukprot:6183269-Pleurochrysis_carterae.AAC.3
MHLRDEDSVKIRTERRARSQHDGQVARRARGGQERRQSKRRGVAACGSAHSRGRAVQLRAEAIEGVAAEAAQRARDGDLDASAVLGNRQRSVAAVAGAGRSRRLAADGRDDAGLSPAARLGERFQRWSQPELQS